MHHHEHPHLVVRQVVVGHGEVELGWWEMMPPSMSK